MSETITRDSDLDDPNANFWKWCSNGNGVNFEECFNGDPIVYNNKNTKENDALDGTNFQYHITATDLKNKGNKKMQAIIYHNAKEFDKDYGWNMIDSTQATTEEDFYFACTIDCK